MSRITHKALSVVGLTLCLSIPDLASADGTVSKQDSMRTRLVKQADGTTIERLTNTGAGLEYPGVGLPAASQGIEALWDVMLEARPMTALATLPGRRRDEGQTLPEVVDPSLVRNWAEFIDPNLALRWNALADQMGFTNAMGRLPAAGIGRAHPMVRWHLRPAEGVNNSWKNVVAEGAKRNLSGQQALQEWLTLPTPGAKSNPWLTGLGGYRY